MDTQDDNNPILGRGLESLIPQQGGGVSADGNILPADSSSQISSSVMPAADNVAPNRNDFSAQKPTADLPVDKAGLAQPQAPTAKEASQVFAGSGKKKDEGEYIFHIEVEKIKSNPQQPRRNFGEESIRELAASIREFGLLQPIVATKIVREVPTGTEVEYQLIAGERRLMAVKSLGWERIPAIIRNVDLDRERLELAVIENIQREDLSPIETARAMARLQDEFRLTQREIAARLGKSRETVANTMRLLDLPTQIQEALDRKQITESHGRLLLSVDEPQLQQKLFDEIVGNRITTRELKEKVKFLHEDKKKTKEELPPELKMVQEELAARLGAPVLIRRDGESGKITINFYSQEELQNIMNRLGGLRGEAGLSDAHPEQF